MIRGIERLAKDMSTKILTQEVLADNLANVTTPGFKTQRLFLRVLQKVVGRQTQKVTSPEIYTDFTQGPIEHTGRNLDLAIDGEGFFVVRTPLGERYTRCGNFTLNSEGFLTTHSGYLVMGQSGPISISGNKVEIASDGRVLVDGDEVDTIKVVCFRDLQSLRREGNYFASEGQSYFPADMTSTRIVQGALERSNVNPIDEMVEMISLYRHFESEQRSIKMQDESTKTLIERGGSFGKK